MVTLEGKVITSLPDGKYKVEVEYNNIKRIFICYVSGKIRQNHIMVVDGDKVRIEVNEYDTSQGKIVYRIR